MHKTALFLLKYYKYRPTPNGLWRLGALPPDSR